MATHNGGDPELDELWKLLENNDTQAAQNHLVALRRKAVDRLVREANTRSDTTPREAIKSFRTYEKDDPVFAEKMLREACRIDAKAAFEFYNEYRHVSYAGQILERAAKGSYVSQSLSYLKLFIDQPYAEDVIAVGAKDSPGATLMQYPLWKDKTYATAALDEIFRRYEHYFPPDDAAVVLATYDLWKTHPEAAKLFSQAVQGAKDTYNGHPESLVMHREGYAQHPDANTIFQDGIEATLKKYPGALLQAYKPGLFTPEQWKRATDEASYVGVFDNFHLFKNEPGALKILQKALDTAASTTDGAATAIEQCALYKDQFDVDGVLRKASQNVNLGVIFDHLDLFKDKPWITDKLMKEALTSGDNLIRYHFLDVVGLREGGNIILMSLQGQEPPAFELLSNFIQIKNKPYAERVVMKCAEVAPASVLDYYEQHKNNAAIAKAFENIMSEKFFHADVIFANLHLLPDGQQKNQIIITTVEKLRQNDSSPRLLVAYYGLYKELVPDAAQIVKDNFDKAVETYPEYETLPLLAEHRLQWQEAFNDSAFEKTEAVRGFYFRMSRLAPYWILENPQAYADVEAHQDMEKSTFHKQALDNCDAVYALTHPELYKDDPDARTYTLSMANKKPQEAFRAYPQYKDKITWADDVLARAVTVMREGENFHWEHAEFLLQNFDAIAEKPYAQATLEQIITRKEMSDQGVSEFFDFFYLFEEQPYVGSAVIALANLFPDKVFFYCDRLSPKYAPAVMLTIAEKSPTTILDHPDQYEYSEEVIEKAARRAIAEKYYQTVAEAYELLRDKPYAEELFLEVARHKPQHILYKKATFLLNEDYGEDVVEAAEEAQREAEKAEREKKEKSK
ncbi:MAG: hypothetical protein AAB588_06580 [Patescibacteria group bacterium]